MADRGRALQGADPAGGSLTLGDLLEENGETLYLDLRQHWDFDLAEFLAGEVRSSPRLILALIRGLPEESRWARHLSSIVGDAAEAVSEVIDPEEAERAEREFWTPDRMLLAQIHNAVVQNTQATGHWKDNKPPEFPLMGPSAKRAQEATAAAKPAQPEGDLLLHHFARLGMPAGGGRL